ncbi:MAG TPA: hypothetical protein DCX07_11385, partial [Phycisphaerales bacterium]|nr:hypothetical protein [Phycisphaerales bacterium]
FTLIELLVVIAILSLLVSILLPSLARAKDLAKGVLCLSMLKSLGTANQLYAEEFNDYTVPMMMRNWTRYWTGNRAFLSLLGITATDDVPHNSQSLPWENPYWPENLLCPSSGAFNWPTNNPDRQGYYRAGKSWGMNNHGLYISRDATGQFQYVVRRAQIEAMSPSAGGNKPSEKIFMLDFLWEEANAGATGNWKADPTHYYASGEGGTYLAYRHLDAANVAFHDGHSETATPSFLFNGGSSQTIKDYWKLKEIASEN